MRRNPYTLLFGKEPVELISRGYQSVTVTDSFLQKVPVQQIYLITLPFFEEFVRERYDLA